MGALSGLLVSPRYTTYVRAAATYVLPVLLMESRGIRSATSHDRAIMINRPSRRRQAQLVVGLEVGRNDVRYRRVHVVRLALAPPSNHQCLWPLVVDVCRFEGSSVVPDSALRV